jgi:hypothetical protein
VIDNTTDLTYLNEARYVKNTDEILTASTALNSPLMYNVGGTTKVGNDYNYSTQIKGGGSVQFRIDNTERMRINNSGNVGINVTSPNGKLHINGTSGGLGAAWNIRVGPSYGYGDNYQKWFIRDMGSQGAMSIYATGDIVTGGLFVGHSDERIKKDIVDVDDGSALESLRLLKPKRYRYVDEAKGIEPVWGFLAQDVSNVIPYATQLMSECIPNIYETATVSDSNVITFTNFETNNISSVLKILDTNDDSHLIHIAEVIDKHSIRVEEDVSAWTGGLDEDENIIAGDKLFVYGEQVDDFHILNKNAIWTVATSALQELDRRLEAEKTKVSDLLARVEALENNIT